MSRTYFADGKIRANQFKAAVNHAKQELEPVQRAYRSSGWDTAVGASGTILAIQQVLRNMGMDQGGITREGLEKIRKSLLQAKQLENISLPGLPTERSAVFPGGVAILYAIFEALDIELMQATSGALREGVIHDLLGRAYQKDVRDTTVRDLVSRYHIDEKHGSKVRETAIGLLAQAAEAWQLTDPNDALMLTWAAELHEIGLHIAHSQFHRRHHLGGSPLERQL